MEEDGVGEAAILTSRSWPRQTIGHDGPGRRTSARERSEQQRDDMAATAVRAGEAAGRLAVAGAKVGGRLALAGAKAGLKGAKALAASRSTANNSRNV